jgi:hypothetical protein
MLATRKLDPANASLLSDLESKTTALQNQVDTVRAHITHVQAKPRGSAAPGAHIVTRLEIAIADVQQTCGGQVKFVIFLAFLI